MRSLVENEIEVDEGSVWVLADRKQINYSDGPLTERYLSKVLQGATDLSSGSFELERCIRDWPTEYHLSRSRAQLLRGFCFDRSKTVLEVGCGCGAITRFLGETFGSVTAIEGSLARARLARLRTRDQNNVSILAAPFQDVKFRASFDIVFCIGVLEYAGMFVDAPDSFDFVLCRLADLLNDDGVAFIAIENQFGLKYFCSSREDHTGIMFDGLEGYPRWGGKVKTFGYHELKERVSRFFSTVSFYFPYPDYKMPSCVLSEELFHRVTAGELVGRFRSRDYAGPLEPLFDERLVLLELANNHMLPLFSNSFLVVAGKKAMTSVGFPSLGVMYSYGRVRELQTVTQFIAQDDGSVLVRKRPVEGPGGTTAGLLSLRACESPWIDGVSLHAQLVKRSKQKRIGLKELFSPCSAWLEQLRLASFQKDGRAYVPGAYLDWIFSNAHFHNGTCVFVDRELEWKEDLPFGVLVIRALFLFLMDVTLLRDISPALRSWSGKVTIKKAAASFGVVLSRIDFTDFCRLEAQLQRAACGRGPVRTSIYIRLFLWKRPVLDFARQAKGGLTKLRNKARRLADRFLKMWRWGLRR